MKPRTSKKLTEKRSGKSEEDRGKGKEKIVLPPKYYHANFCSLLSFVEDLYGNILEERELQFIHKFQSLSEDGQCLFIRMANRRNVLFWRDRLLYEELEITPELWDKLYQCGLAEDFAVHHDEEYPLALWLMTKPELLDMAATLELDIAWIKKAKKLEVIQALPHELPFEDFLSYIQNYQPIVRQNGSEVYEFLLFLYFGNRYSDMSEFVIRDLKHIKLEDFSEHDFTPYFQTRKDADDKWMISEYRQQFYLMREGVAPEEVASYFQRELPRHHELAPIAHNSLDRLLLKIGVWLEKQRLPRQAMQFYQQTSRPPARERQVRLLQKQKKNQEALSLCYHILETYQNAPEKYFALDFIRKEEEGKRLKSTTVYLKKAPSCELSQEDHQYAVEQGVLEWFHAQGYEGVHVENWIWRSLFGLIFWDMLFEDGADSIHNPFQRMPSDLYHPDFYIRREARIKEQLESLEDKEVILQMVQRRVEEKWGIVNPFIYWDERLLEYANRYIHYLSPPQLKAVMLEMAKRIRDNSTGFPDLFVYKEDDYKFVEVKSPSDSLSAQQLHWLELFEEEGIQAQVMKVKWK